jgi:alanine racemase
VQKRVKIDPLQKRVITWKRSKIMSVKKGENWLEFMGYGTSFLAERKMKVAVIPIGYSMAIVHW